MSHIVFYSYQLIEDLNDHYIYDFKQNIQFIYYLTVQKAFRNLCLLSRIGLLSRAQIPTPYYSDRAIDQTVI